jgi:hypothetical protein
MRLAARALILAAALALAAPAPAQAPPQAPPQALPQPGQPAQPASPDVVVTGTRERTEQVRDFVRALTPATSGSIARFIDRVCPYVTGLRPAQNEAVAARLRAIAEAVGLDVAGRDCTPNALVIVTENKGAFIEALRRRQPGSFGAMTSGQVRSLGNAPGPAAAWQLEGPVDSDGVPLFWDNLLGAYRNDTVQAASRIRSHGGRAFDAAALVVEASALEGLTWVQLSDYAAMRLFAQLDPARLRGDPPPTILTVLTTPMGSPVPITMTSWDLGFLRGLYDSRTDLTPSGQRSDIVRGVRRELEAR